MALFHIQHLTFSYPDHAAPALQDLTLTVNEGEFLVLCGASGSGKSTLLRHLKTALTPHGTCSGTILFDGAPLSSADSRTQSSAIGFVLQSPEDQIVTDKVWHELAFGLENLGCDSATIRRRVAEMASYFGIEDWFHRDVNSLSGGQKQLLNLASVMVMQPRVLVLDEPTAQLDPIAAGEFLAVLHRINRDLGTTVILSEHRLEDALPMAHRAAVLDAGRLLCCGTPREIGAHLRTLDHGMFLAMPTPLRVWAAAETDAPCPITVNEGRDFLTAHSARYPLQPLDEPPLPPCAPPVIIAKHLWFRYEKDSPDVLQDLSLSVGKGELFALLGGNGAGKSTLLRLLGGILRPYRGTVQTTVKTALLPQEPRTLFVKNTLRAELESSSAPPQRIAQIVHLCRLLPLLDRHPFDLSGGEQQRAALAKLLLTEPELLLLDEPTKGLDATFKRQLAAILRRLTARGITVVMVSHDIDFCACCAHRCALLFDGAIVTEAAPRPFFSGNSFYTTAANRMARHLLPTAVTAEDVMTALGVPPQTTPPDDTDPPPLPPPPPDPLRSKPPRLPLWRKALGLFSCAAALISLAFLLFRYELSTFTAEPTTVLPLYGAALLSLWVTALCLSRHTAQMPSPTATARKLSPRTVALTALSLLLIPLTLLATSLFLERSHYNLVSFLVLLECMLPFFLFFEGRRPQARELVLIAALCAIGIAGRAALFMLPQCKPVLALTIISAVAFGGETGFLVGAMTMLTSNLLFGQGPWTPWQMFAMGLIGFLAGVLSRRGLLRCSRLSLALFGLFSAIVLYGGILNPGSALIFYGGDLTPQLLLAYCLTGLPMDCVHGISTALFLYLAAEPMLEKLRRIKSKYALLS